jgi:Leucine-rich repeat (LRR) protein
MTETYTIEQGNKGSVLVARSAWNDKMTEAISRRGIHELEINYAKGFVGKDLSFLKELSGIEALTLIHRTIDDISPIHHLHDLRVLVVHTYCKTEIDFNQFPALEQCTLEWRAKASSIFSRTTLKKLFINSYSGKDTEKFARLLNLESLSLANGGVRSLEGLASLKHLTFLGLYNLRKLESLDGIESLDSIEHLEINGCKNVRSIESIAALKNLKKIHLCDDGHIESLRPLIRLNNLEEVLFYDSTNILDGDLSLLTELPRLKNVAFADRPHYTSNIKEFEMHFKNE